MGCSMRECEERDDDDTAYHEDGVGGGVRASYVGLALLVVLAAFGLFFAPHAPPAHCCAAPPSPDHLFGTAKNGADLAAAALRGLGTTAAIGIAATMLALLFGVAWRALASVLPRRVDDVMMRAVD